MHPRLGSRLAALRALEPRTWVWAGVLVVAFQVLAAVSSRFIIPPSHSAVLWLPAGLTLLSQLVEELLDVSRIHTGRLSLQLERVELEELVEAVAEQFAAISRGRLRRRTAGG